MNKLRDKLDPKYVKICTYALFTVLTLCVILMMLYHSQPFWKTMWNMFTAMLKPVIIGGIICYLFLPLVHRIERFLSKNETKWRRPAAVAILYGAIALILLIIILGLFWFVKGSLDDLSKLDYKEIQEFLLSMSEQFSDQIKQIEERLSAANLPFAKAGSLLTKFVAGVTSFFSGLLFGVIFSIYFMLDGEHILTYWERAFRLIAGEQSKAAVKQFAMDADKAFSGYIRGQFLDAALVGVISTIALMIAGVPYAAVIGVMIGIGNLIPYFGPILGYGAVIIICLLMGQFDKLVIGLLIIIVIMFIDGNVINPRLLSDNVEVHPLLVVAALLGGGAIGGFVGMLVAVPTAALVKIQFDRYLDSKEKAAESSVPAEE